MSATSPEPPRPPGRGRRRVAAGAALLVVAAIVVAAVLASRGHRHRATVARSTGTAVAVVARRNLVTSADATGKVRYAGSATVVNRLIGTLTWTAGVGRVIEPGGRLFDVNNFPVILLDGSTPAYRPLDAADTPGPDVRQLNADLIGLGFDEGGIVDDDEWQTATTDGVDAFQQAHGEPVTGSLELGSVVFLRGAQRVAGPAGASGGAGASTADDDPTGGHAVFADTTVTTTQTTTARAPATKGSTGRSSSSGAAIGRLQSEVGQLRREDGQLQHRLHAAAQQAAVRAAAIPASGGDTAVFDTTSTTLVVSASVPAGSQSVTRVGARVPVTLPSGQVVRGRVVSVGSGSSKVPITIHLLKRESGRDLDQATVSVHFVARIARHVLSVPVTALVAQPGGHYAVQEADPPGALVRVRLGTFATGDVQVSGAGLHAGLRVTESQG